MILDDMPAARPALTCFYVTMCSVNNAYVMEMENVQINRASTLEFAYGNLKTTVLTKLDNL